MFKSFREKVGSVVKGFGKKIEEEAEVIEETDDSEKQTDEEIEEPDDSKEEKAEDSEEQTDEEIDEPDDSVEESDDKEEVVEKKGFFKSLKNKVSTFTLTQEKFEDLFWELELALLENNTAQEVIDKIKEDLAEELVDKRITRKNPEEEIKNILRESIKEILEQETFDLTKKEKPVVIALIGVNGSGKTTSLAKLAYKLKDEGVVIAASDTFRAAAIQQVEEHANKIGVKLIKHDYNSDPTAVAFDAVKHAESKGLKYVLIDTAGRLHSNDNLMQELQKLTKKLNPIKIFVGESITGNDCVEQAKTYNEKIGIDGIILSKADTDEKGGAAISVSYITKKPILYIGTGQEYKDLKEYDSEEILNTLGL